MCGLLKESALKYIRAVSVSNLKNGFTIFEIGLIQFTMDYQIRRPDSSRFYEAQPLAYGIH